ncbi:MAG TPA: hypothetical protein VNO33_10065 [Kofleriaceae bacterium]|nr:hypothetical protein [Kofleriaceae bacterium]
MGVDCSVIFYAGPVLSAAELARAFRSIADGRLGTMTLAISHAEGVTARSEAAPVHAISCFEKVGRHGLPGDDPIERLGDEAAQQGWSLSRIVEESWKVTRKAIRGGKIVDREGGAPRATLPDDWQVAIAAEISALRGRALWATVCDHSALGAYAICEMGAAVDQRELDGDEYESQPDSALASFAGVQQASVQAAFRDPWERGATPRCRWWLLAEEGHFLDLPRAVEPSELEGFQHMIA